MISIMSKIVCWHYYGYKLKFVDYNKYVPIYIFFGRLFNSSESFINAYNFLISYKHYDYKLECDFNGDFITFANIICNDSFFFY